MIKVKPNLFYYPRILESSEWSFLLDGAEAASGDGQGE